MGDKTAENTNAESTKKTFPPKLSLYTIESAASLMALGKIVIGKEWDKNTDIHAKRQMLQEELCKVENGWRSPKALASIIKLVNFTLNRTKDNYPDSYRQELEAFIESIFSENENLYSCYNEFKDSIKRIFDVKKNSDSYRQELEACVESIFSKYNDLDSYRKGLWIIIDHSFSVDADSYRYELEDRMNTIFRIDPYSVIKPFYEIFNKLQYYYKDMKSVIYGDPKCKICELSEHIIADDDFLKVCKYCVSGRPQYVKTVQEIYKVIKDALNAEVDKFGIFFFPSDYFTQDVPKGIIQVSAEGIRAWLKHNGINDAYFNPVSGKLEMGIADTPEPTAAPSDTDESQNEAAIGSYPASTPEKPITWTSTNADFADLIIALQDAGYIKADNPTAALRIAAPHFSGVNQDVKNLLQGYENRRTKGYKFKDIPAAGTQRRKQSRSKN